MTCYNTLLLQDRKNGIILLPHLTLLWIFHLYFFENRLGSAFLAYLIVRIHTECLSSTYRKGFKMSFIIWIFDLLSILYQNRDS